MQFIGVTRVTSHAREGHIIRIENAPVTNQIYGISESCLAIHQLLLDPKRASQPPIQKECPCQGKIPHRTATWQGLPHRISHTGQRPFHVGLKLQPVNQPMR